MASTISTTASSAQENLALNQLLTKYKHDLSGGAGAGTLSGLSRQITVAARTAGEHVTLPLAPFAGNEVPSAAKVDLTA